MQLVTLKNWVYPQNPPAGKLPYYPSDAVGRHIEAVTPTPYQEGVYTPDKVVEGYNSLIWKEAFRGSGEFELKTNNIDYTLDILPQGTLVSLLDSNEVYIVTTHSIEIDENNNDVLTVLGEPLLIHLLSNRPTHAYVGDMSYDGAENAAENVNLIYQIPDHLAFVLWGGLVYPHSQGGWPNTHKFYELPFNIIVPHVAISQSIFQKGDYYRSEWPPPVQTRLDSVSELLDADQNYGVRTVRPRGMSASIYTPNLNSVRGEGSSTVTHNITKMLFDIYQGEDRSEGNERLIFKHDSGDIETSQYLSSLSEHKNVVSTWAEVNKEDAQFADYNPPNIYMISWDGDEKLDFFGTPIITNPEERRKVVGIDYRLGSVQSSAKIKEIGYTTATVGRLHADATKFLKENRKIDMISATMSPYTQYRFKEDYNLGDIVVVHGKYGDPQKMVVSEFTRTEDENGEEGYPTLVKWEEPLT